ncbi:Nramp family divalent metal transporter [Thermus scotoductus]|uniref:Divalent metal cation transporter MntH n=1 Tax=Thermus scotoductus TaxID=37636 RepID=A0A430S0T2_THESC|nr:Nramp family divalent metal transporter [Thermus scotoductus]RTG97270.1 divalent metal cation transporter [Thermus scotoductus]RTH27134.1 divalent metal cation transporter [Thermus scotoductus]
MITDRLLSHTDQETVRQAVAVLERHSQKRGLARLLPFLGPAFVASVAYIDPGNFATNIQGGAKFGYLLLWVILAANLMAMLIQFLSSKLGIVTGANLPEVIRQEWPRPLVWFYWIQAEVIAMATDLAEFLGATLALNLLFGIPLFWGAVLTGIAAFGILALQRYGFRPLEAAIAVFVGVIALAYVVQLFLSKPGLEFVQGLIPRFQGGESLYLAVGILGATVMPHVIYLHSDLTKNRVPAADLRLKRRLLRFNLLDVVIAMSIAGLINMSMLAAAAATFHATGKSDIADLTTAYQTLTPLLGPLAAVAFGVALLASGISSSTVGTMSGQVIMQSFVGFQIPLWLRRLITMLPAFVVILLGLNPTNVLVLSQVVLSFGIPFALIPLLLFTANRRIMGELANSKLVTYTGWVIATLIIGLNLYLLYQTLLGG